ncbi:MAG: alpha/beta hydrolase [Bacteroidetes bacterium]|nr:alpha/beta hydrolase [Bacteroidota bacterium]
MKNKIIILAAILITAVSCKKNSEEPVSPNGDISGHYELKANSPNAGELDKHYWMTFVQNETSLSGDIEVLDSTGTLIKGTVSGFQQDGTFNVNADLGYVEHSFTFSGSFDPSKKPAMLSGTLSRNYKSSQVTTFPVNMMAIGDYRCKDSTPTNPYVFRKVWAAQNPSGPPVVFVHGMTGSMHNWDSIVMNLSAAFKEKHDVWEFQYNWKDSIIINGRALKDSVTRYALGSPILIGHSMGGLVSRGYIVSGGAFTRLVTLGTPHLGTPLVNFISAFCALDYPGPQNMLPQGQYIQAILHDPIDIASRSKYYVIAGRMNGSYQMVAGVATWVWQEDYYFPTDKKGFALFETVFLGQHNDGLVPVLSAEFDGAAVNKPLALQEWVDHVHLTSPSHAPQIMDYINGL